MKIYLLLGKHDIIAELAYSFLNNNSEIVEVVYGDQDIKDRIVTEDFEYVISFLNPKIIKDTFLLKKKCINFHPSLPDYRGVCCASLALLNNDKKFGATVHILNKKIDSGDIFDKKEIDVYDNEDCFSLSFRAKVACLELLYNFVNFVNKNNKLPPTKPDYKWGNTLMTYKKFKKMITFTKEEVLDNLEYYKQIERCVKNDHFPGPYII